MAKDKENEEFNVEKQDINEEQNVKQEKPVKEKKKCKKDDKESEKLKKELEEKNDMYLRLAAEYDNFRRRSQKEKDSLYSECKATVIKELLAVIDNFERCIAFNDNTNFEDYRKGVEMTYKQFTEAFGKLGIESFGEQGEQFDPNLHNAVMHSEDENLPENTIQNVLMKGYKIGDKVIRPAMVAVAN